MAAPLLVWVCRRREIHPLFSAVPLTTVMKWTLGDHWLLPLAGYFLQASQLTLTVC